VRRRHTSGDHDGRPPNATLLPLVTVVDAILGAYRDGAPVRLALLGNLRLVPAGDEGGPAGDVAGELGSRWWPCMTRRKSRDQPDNTSAACPDNPE